MDGKYFINPGSATGAYSSLSSYRYLIEILFRNNVPGFVLLEFKESMIVVYMY